MLQWLRLMTTWAVLIRLANSTSPDLLLVPRDVPIDAVPLRLWANPRQSVLKPRKRDLHQRTLMAALEPHFEPEWMSLSRPTRPPSDISGRRKSTLHLENLASSFGLSDTVKEWLVSRGSCPLSYSWRDLGSDFWPRWVRTATCLRPVSGTCSWPPGMSCVSGPPRHLHVLRWHCRLRKKMKRKKASENTVLNSSKKDGTSPVPKTKKGRRKRYRCLWVKVPYPVPEDCVCGCS